MKKRIAAFKFAFQGIFEMVRSQTNAKIQLAATVLVIGLSVAAGLNKIEWCWIIAAIASVWFVEAVNTALEKLCDVVSPGYNENVKIAKDVAAGAVLIASIAAAIIGIIILGPPLWAFWVNR